MPGWGDLFGGLFGGGDNSGVTDPGSSDWMSSITDADITSVLGGDGSTPFDAITANGGVDLSSLITPASGDNLSTIYDSLGGFTDTPGQNIFGSLGDWTKTIAGLSGGGGGGNTVSPLTVTGTRPATTQPVTQIPPPDTTGLHVATPDQPINTTPGQPPPGAGKLPPGASGAHTTPPTPATTPPPGTPFNLTQFLSGAANNAGLLALIPGVLSAINARGQTDLGPDAAALRTQATNNQNLINSLTAEAQAEKVGNLPGPAMESLSRSLAEQKASERQAYANSGMSGSSAEGADLAALNAGNEGQRFQIGQNMAQQGLSQVNTLTGQDVGIYQNLMDAQTARDNEYMQAMSNVMEGLGRALSGTTSSAPTNTLAPGGSQPSTTPIDPLALASAVGLPANWLQVAGVAGGDGGGTVNPAASILSGIDPAEFVGSLNRVGEFATPGAAPDPNQLDPALAAALQNDPNFLQSLLTTNF